MQREGLFNFTPAALGIDPASRVVGICLMLGDGRVVNTWSIRAEGQPLRRLCTIHTRIRELFDFIEDDSDMKMQLGGSEIEVYIEEGMFGGRKPPKVTSAPNGEATFQDFGARISAMAGEVRGAILAEAWRHRWKVRKMYVQSWKTLMTKAERQMKKNREYVDYWNTSLGLEAKYPDEIDAYFIARRAIVGRREP